MKLLELYKEKVMGAINGLDRIRFRGTLRWLANEKGLNIFLRGHGILLKEFKGWVMQRTAALRQSCDDQAEALGVETIYLNRSGINKEELARQMALEKGISEGPICNFSVLETCFAPQVRGNKALKQLELKMRSTKCVHLYHYFNHAQYGFGHIRLQSWVPFNMFICLNGRHWLERQLQNAGIAYRKEGNCFPWIEDVSAAQELLDLQMESNWNEVLTGLVRQMCPDLAEAIFPARPDYYWSADETEWASDIMFHSRDELDRLFPHLLYHGLKTDAIFGSLRW